MKSTVVVEMFGCCIEQVKVFLSDTTAQDYIKAWFKENYPHPGIPGYEGNYHSWKAGQFEFHGGLDECHEIYEFECEVLGATGQDICKGCKERKP